MRFFSPVARSSFFAAFLALALVVPMQACDELSEAACSFFTGDCSDGPLGAGTILKFYTVEDVEYNYELDTVIATTRPAETPHEFQVEGPFKLVSVDPVTQVERSIELSMPGKYVSVGPSGMDAAVVLVPVDEPVASAPKGGATNATVVHIDLIDMEILDTQTVTGLSYNHVTDVVLDGNGIAHVFGQSAVFSVDLMTGSVTPGETGLAGPKAKLAADGNHLIVIEDGVLQRFDISGGDAVHDIDSPSGRDLDGCFPDDTQNADLEELLALSADGMLIFTPCGDVFTSPGLVYVDTVDRQDLVYHNDEDRNFFHMAAYEDTGPLAGVSFAVLEGVADQPVIGFFDLDSGDLESVLLPRRPTPFSVTRFIFFSSDGERLVLVIRAGVYAGLGPTTYPTQIFSYPVP